MKPRILVLLCTHNGERFLPALLASLAAQTVLPERIEVHDWASRDATCALVEAFAAAQAGRLPVTLVRHDEAPGAGPSFLRALAHCAGHDGIDHVALCDQDDVWDSQKLAVYGATLEAHPDTDVLYGDVQLIGPEGQRLAPSFYGAGSPFQAPQNLADPSLLLVNPVIGMTMSISRRLLAEVVPGLSGPWLMHDWALLLLAADRGASMRYVPTPLVNYRQHGANVLGAAQGLRIMQRLRKARAQFRRLRAQAAWLASVGHGEQRLSGTFGGAGRDSRWRAAVIALHSRLLKPAHAAMLSIAIALFW